VPSASPSTVLRACSPAAGPPNTDEHVHRGTPGRGAADSAGQEGLPAREARPKAPWEPGRAGLGGIHQLGGLKPETGGTFPVLNYPSFYCL